MKRTILIVAATCGLINTYAQKGSVLVFGNVSSSTGHNNDLTNTSRGFSLLTNVGVGYQFSKHFTVGPQGGYIASAGKTVSPVTGTERSYSYEIGIGAFGRYTAYITPAIFAYLQADVGYNQAGTKGKTLPPRKGADLFPGIGAFVYRHWAVNLTVGGVDYKRFSDNGITQSSLNFDLASKFQFGISKNFVRHEKSKNGNLDG
jgi:hypothetical protein